MRAALQASRPRCHFVHATQSRIDCSMLFALAFRNADTAVESRNRDLPPQLSNPGRYAFLVSLQVQQHVIAQYSDPRQSAQQTVDRYAESKKVRVLSGPVFHVGRGNRKAHACRRPKPEKRMKRLCYRTQGWIVHRKCLRPYTSL